MNEPSQSILQDDGVIQDQVLLPNRIAMGICVKGIKTRLGRSVVTLLGVGLGITFLMAVVTGFHVKAAMGEQAERMRAVDRRVALLRSEIGTLTGKNIVLLASQPGPEEIRFVEQLREQGAVLRVSGDIGPDVSGVTAAEFPGDLASAAAVVGVGQYAAAERFDDVLAGIGESPLLVVSAPVPEVAKRVAAKGIRCRTLDVELREDEKREAARRAQEAKVRVWWIVIVSLFITVIGIANAMLMSVTERIREIGTMKCLGALSSFVVKLFLIESSLIGLVGSTIGALIGILFSLLAYSYRFGLIEILKSVDYGMLAIRCGQGIAAGVFLAIFAAIYPAFVAARMIPADALTSNV